MGEANEGVPLQDHQKESGRITLRFWSLRGPFGEAWEGG